MADQVNKLFNSRIKEGIIVKKSMLKDRQLMEDFANMSIQCLNTLKAHGRILFCGNGGSAADAQHIAAELSGRFYKDRSPLDSEALHVNTSFLTAVANDYSFSETYSRLVEAKGRKGDVLIAISTSGNSENIVKAVVKANEMELTTVAWTGNKPSKLHESAKICLKIPSSDTPRIQECHIVIGHILCEYLENSLF